MRDDFNKKTIGIMGGMGPLATVELFKLLVEYTDYNADQDQIHIIIDNDPTIPDRTSAIIKDNKAPLPKLIHSAKLLKSAGADFLLLPCNTSHYYLREVQSIAEIKIMNMIDLTAKTLHERNISTIGLLATSGCIFKKVYETALTLQGISTIVPSNLDQSIVMDYIYKGIKTGDLDYDLAGINSVANKMIQCGAEVIILGCTELSIMQNAFSFQEKCIDPLRLYAKAAVIESGYPLKNGI